MTDDINLPPLHTRLDTFRRAHWMHWADPADNDLIHEVIAILADRASRQPEPQSGEREALAELVALENMRLRLQSLHERGHGTDYEHYHQSLQIAWTNARKALTQPQAQQATKPQDKVDAERYRFIRDVPWICTGTPLERVISQQRNAHWDTSIDTAIAATKDSTP